MWLVDTVMADLEEGTVVQGGHSEAAHPMLLLKEGHYFHEN